MKQHRATMIGLFAGAMSVAGIFTLWPGRIMYDMVFGSTQSPTMSLRKSLTLK